MEFTNNSLKTPKIGKLNIDTLITPQGLLIHEKNPDQKSLATVPLRMYWRDSKNFFDIYPGFRIIIQASWSNPAPLAHFNLVFLSH